jgi:hypothetical protein
MAEINPGILELVETLVAAGADWLAFELLDEIRLGRPVDHDEDSPERTVGELRVWEGESLSTQEREARDLGVEPILTEEQIAFAADFIAGRISEIIEMTTLSLENLQSIFLVSRGDRLEPQVGTPPSVDLGFEDSTFHFTAGEEKQMFLLLDSLRASLSEWVKAARREASEP